MAFAVIFGVLAWSLAGLPVAAKYRMTSVAGFIGLKTADTAIPFSAAGGLIALVFAPRKIASPTAAAEKKCSGW